MSQFKETVEKIAASPLKLRMFGLAPHFITKEAGVMRKLFGGGQTKNEGYQDILKHVAMGTSLGAVQASGAILMDQAVGRFFGDQNQEKSNKQELGKLNAQNAFKHQMNAQLQAEHDAVYKRIVKDEVIAKADRPMIQSAFDTMRRFAPNLAADENATRSFLREHAIYGTGPSYASLKNLAEAEQAVARAGGATKG